MKFLIENPALIAAAWLCVAVILFLAYRKYTNKKVQMCSDATERMRLQNNYLVFLFTGAMLWLSGAIGIGLVFSSVKPWQMLVCALLSLPIFLKDYKRKPKSV